MDGGLGFGNVEIRRLNGVGDSFTIRGFVTKWFIAFMVMIFILGVLPTSLE